jgi:hypothetical protein
VRASQDLIPRESRLVGVGTAQVRVIPAAVVASVDDAQIVITAKDRFERLIASDYICFLVLLGHLERQIVRILDRENRTPHVRI